LAGWIICAETGFLGSSDMIKCAAAPSVRLTATRRRLRKKQVELQADFP
jgi:hypothetical protein